MSSIGEFGGRDYFKEERHGDKQLRREPHNDMQAAGSQDKSVKHLRDDEIREVYAGLMRQAQTLVTKPNPLGNVKALFAPIKGRSLRYMADDGHHEIKLNSSMLTTVLVPTDSKTLDPEDATRVNKFFHKLHSSNDSVDFCVVPILDLKDLGLRNFSKDSLIVIPADGTVAAGISQKIEGKYTVEINARLKAIPYTFTQVGHSPDGNLSFYTPKLDMNEFVVSDILRAGYNFKDSLKRQLCTNLNPVYVMAFFRMFESLMNAGISGYNDTVQMIEQVIGVGKNKLDDTAFANLTSLISPIQQNIGRFDDPEKKQAFSAVIDRLQRKHIISHFYDPEKELSDNEIANMFKTLVADLNAGYAEDPNFNRERIKEHFLMMKQELKDLLTSTLPQITFSDLWDSGRKYGQNVVDFSNDCMIVSNKSESMCLGLANNMISLFAHGTFYWKIHCSITNEDALGQAMESLKSAIKMDNKTANEEQIKEILDFLAVDVEQALHYLAKNSQTGKLKTMIVNSLNRIEAFPFSALDDQLKTLEAFKH